LRANGVHAAVKKLMYICVCRHGDGRQWNMADRGTTTSNRRVDGVLMITV